MKKKKYIKLKKDLSKKLNYKIEFDWSSYYDLKRRNYIEALKRSNNQ